jgi:hypothetical protein
MSMNVPLLIDAIVRQVTVLIAQLATSGGVRAPLAHIANQVFVELANELAAQGVSRKVGADMFGMALRAYLRKVRRLNESSTEHGLTLWKAVLEYLGETPRSRDEVLARFHRDDEVQVRAVLHDLTDSGLLFASGAGTTTLYRAASDTELVRLRQLSAADGLEQLIWVLIYREGPIEAELLARRLRMSASELAGFADPLAEAGHITRQLRDGSTYYDAADFSVPFGARTGWEAAVFDHFQALVQTIAQRLRGGPQAAGLDDLVGGSTYSFDIWPGHPLADEVRGVLRRFREQHTALRARVDEYNRGCTKPADYEQVVAYAGQCILPRGSEQTTEHDDE